MPDVRVAFKGMDDGARISIYNDAYPAVKFPDGKIDESGYVMLNQDRSGDLSKFMRPGNNRIVITQVDACAPDNRLEYANITIDDVEVQTAKVPELPEQARARIKPVESSAPSCSANEIAHWSFEDNTDDVSGNGHHAKTKGEASYTVGYNGRGLSLGGGKSQGVIVSKPISKSIFETGDYTISGAFRTPGNARLPQDIVSALGGGGGHGILIELGGDGRLRFLHRLPFGNSGGTDLHSKDGVNLNDNEFHTFSAMTSDQKLKLYVDGKLQAEANEKSEFNTDLIVYIGMMTDRDVANNRFFKGELDEIRIHNASLICDQSVDDKATLNNIPDVSNHCLASAGARFTTFTGVVGPTEGICKSNATLACFEQVDRSDPQSENEKACGAIGEGDIVRLAGGGSISGRGYGCKTLKDDPRNLGASLCISKPGPQSPRDINTKNVVTGTNDRNFNTAPVYSKMNLCNIHLHKNAEHKAINFSKDAGVPGESGYVVSKSSPGEHLAVGDTIEVHYVYSSADVQPGEHLTSCFVGGNDKQSIDNQGKTNPVLRVEAQVFELVKQNGKDFEVLTQINNRGIGDDKAFHSKATNIPDGNAIEYQGSTTGPVFNDKPSPYLVTWNVRTEVQKVNIETVEAWLKPHANVFEEHHAHGVRNLVTKAGELSIISN